MNLSDNINHLQLDASLLPHCGSGSVATFSLNISQAVAHLRGRTSSIQSTNLIKYQRTVEMRKIRILLLIMNMGYFMTSQEKEARK